MQKIWLLTCQVTHLATHINILKWSLILERLEIDPAMRVKRLMSLKQISKFCHATLILYLSYTYTYQYDICYMSKTCFGICVYIYIYIYTYLCSLWLTHDSAKKPANLVYESTWTWFNVYPTKHIILIQVFDHGTSCHIGNQLNKPIPSSSSGITGDYPMALWFFT